MTEPTTAPPTEPVDAVSVVSPEEAFHLSAEFIRSVTELLEALDIPGVRAILAPLHRGDIAYLLDVVPSHLRPPLVEALRAGFDPAILLEVDAGLREEIIGLLGIRESAKALTHLDTEDAVDVIEDLDVKDQRQILEAIPAAYREELEEGLAYPENSAGRLMNRRLVMLPEYWTVGSAIDFLRRSDELPSDFYQIFIADPKYRPVGGLLLSRLIRSKREVHIRDIMEKDIRSIPAEMDQEEVAYIFRKYGMVSAPVVNTEGRMVGVITLDDVVDVIEEETDEDILRMGGITSDDKFSGVVTTVRQRFPWLFVNLLTAIAASVIVWFFSGTIEKAVALAVLMPIVASMGGNAGTQTLTVAVRALATREFTSVNALRVIGKELLVGGLNGMLFALITGLSVYGFYHDATLSAVFGAATVLTLSCAGLAGALIPLGLEKMGVDPAIASGVFLTTVTDMVGFLAFLGLAALILL